MAIKLFRCRICGDPYMGDEKPTHCPFCGATKDYLVPGGEWKEENRGVELTAASKANLEAALELEIDNTQFYACAAKCAEKIEANGIFKSLSKVEREHASTISKLLGIDKPSIGEKEICLKSDKENFGDSLRREKGAVEKYGKFLSEATEERLKYFFKALIEIESTHIALAENELK